MTRARKALHLLRSDYKYNYPLGADYLIYTGEKMTDKSIYSKTHSHKNKGPKHYKGYKIQPYEFIA